MRLGHWLSVRQTAESIGYTEDTVRLYCAQSRQAREQGRPEDAIFPGATKSSDSERAHWRIPEEDVRNFGATRAVSQTTVLDHRRRKQLMAARRQAA
ncbi:hypothetical protein [Nesterenkonia populi]|uniref:hypothetical protein n=1 Tax=Nesterenkonia populi TaxID=1591087 RepID=UPI0011BD893C|nr:hypothetical protein [Nesterenkonia populi]